MNMAKLTLLVMLTMLIYPFHGINIQSLTTVPNSHWVRSMNILIGNSYGHLKIKNVCVCVHASIIKFIFAMSLDAPPFKRY